MNILRLSTLSLSLAIAVMTLGYATPLQAQDVCEGGAFCDRDGDIFFKDHNRCDICSGVRDCDDSVFSEDNVCVDTGDRKRTYKVEMEIHSESTDHVTCDTFTESGLDGAFPPDSCKVTLADEFWGEPRDYCLFGFAVKNTRKATRVMLWYQWPCGVRTDGVDLWRTLELPGEIVIGSPGDFHLTVPEDGAVLTKNHQPYKETSLDGEIFIGDIIYTEVVQQYSEHLT